MKRVTINTNYVGLVFKKGKLKNVLTAGTYWLGFGEDMTLYDMAKEYYYTVAELDILLENSDFVN